MCSKIGFKSKREANAYKWIKGDSGEGVKKIKKLTPYDCAFCEFWHLTSMKKSASRNLQRKITKRLNRD